MEQKETDRLAKKQLQIIHVAVSRLGMDDCTYRLVLKNRYGKDSAKELTAAQRTDLINYFLASGFRIKPKKTKPRDPRLDAPNVIELMTEQQRRMIVHLVEDLNFIGDGFKNFLSNRFGLDRIKTKDDAHKVIEALKNMRSRGYALKKD